MSGPPQCGTCNWPNLKLRVVTSRRNLIGITLVSTWPRMLTFNCSRRTNRSWVARFWMAGGILAATQGLLGVQDPLSVKHCQRWICWLSVDNPARPFVTPLWNVLSCKRRWPTATWKSCPFHLAFFVWWGNWGKHPATQDSRPGEEQVHGLSSHSNQTVGRFHCGKHMFANCFEGCCHWSGSNDGCNFWKCCYPFSSKVLGKSRPRGGKHSQFGQVGGVPKQACLWVPAEYFVSSLQFTMLKFEPATNLHLYLGFASNGHWDVISLGFLILCSYLARCLRLVSESKLQRNNNLSLALDASFKVWLINETNENHTLASGELFGFGIGSFQEVSSGHLLSPLLFNMINLFQCIPCPSCINCLSWKEMLAVVLWTSFHGRSVETCSGWACAVLTKRRSWLFPRSCVTSQRPGGPQRLVFWITTWGLFARRGMVQKPFKKTDPTAFHNMFVSINMSTCSCQDGATPGEKIPRPFRYLVSMRAKVNAFKPKELAADENMHQLRASQLGATFKEFNALPSSEGFGCIWEVRVFRNTSTQWFCMKSSVKYVNWSINHDVSSFRSTHTHFPLTGEDWRRYAGSYHTYQAEVLSSVQDWAKSHDCNLLAMICLQFWAFWGTCLVLIEGTPLCSKRPGQAIVFRICVFHARVLSMKHLHCILFLIHIFSFSRILTGRLHPIVPIGFPAFMPLDPVTALSDDEPRVRTPKTPPKSKAPKSKASPKATPKGKGRGRGKDASFKRPAAAPAPTTPMKRPAAKPSPVAGSPAKKPALNQEKKLSVCKYKYKSTGIYGIKIDKKEKLRATCLNFVLTEYCHIAVAMLLH